MKRSSLVVLFLAGALSAAWAGGQKELPPALPTTASSPAFLAPANPDATQKSLSLPFAPQAAKGQAIKSWSFVVYDAAGQIVWSHTESQTKDRGFFGEMLNLGPRPEVEIPAQVVWDGTFLLPDGAENGKPVPNGTYTYLLSVADTAGSVTRSAPVTVTIENTPVRIDRLAVENTIFSPQGRRSSLLLEQSGSREARWEGTFTDAQGKAVRSYLWSNPTNLKSADVSPPDFAWDGKDDTGVVLPDGEYHYSLKGSNRSGATAVQALDKTLVISQQQGILRLSSDQSAFSPKADKPWPTVLTLHTASGNPEGLVDWTVTVADPAKPAVRVWSQSGKAPLPETLIFDGKDFLGRAIPDGRYQAQLVANFSNGNAGVSPPALFDLQSVPPKGTLTAASSVFGGSGRADLAMSFTGDAGVTWSLDVVDSSGKTVKTLGLGSSGSASVTVAGTDASGRSLPDGSYLLRAAAHDKSGNRGVAEVGVVKDSRLRKASIDLSRPVVVPGKGSDGQLRITPVLNLLDSVDSGALEIRSGAGELVARQSFQGAPLFWDWPVTDQAGGVPADGDYTVQLTASYNNGENVKETVPLRVDSQYLTAPQGTVSVSAPVFGSSARPTVTASFAGDTGFAWTLEVLDAKNQPARQYNLGSSGSAAVEIGLDSTGKPLADGVYTLRATAKNQAGLAGTASVDVKKDSRPTTVALDLSPPILVPGSSLSGTLKVTPVLAVLDSIESTTLALNKADGSPLLEKTWNGLVPFWNWDGTDSLGKLLPDGTYQVVLSVGYANGARSQAKKDFKLDSSYLKEPQGTLTSSDPVFGGSGRTGVTIAFQGDAGIGWNLEILDKDGKTIRRQALGDSGQAQWNFQGLDDQGAVLPDGPYTLRASATSKAGVAGTALLQLRKDSRLGHATLDLSRSVIVPGKGPNALVRITPLLDFVDSVDKMALSVLGPGGKTVNEKTSNATIPFWDWDGKDATGQALPNGTYPVALTVNYSNGSVSQASGSVKIDSTYLNDQGPLVEMTFSSKTFAPNNVDGPTDLTVAVKTTEGVVPVANWQLVALDPRGKPFRQWSGQGVPPKTIFWDGKSDSGDVVESGEDYQILLRVSDTQGHVTRKQDAVTIDISVIKIGEGKYKIVVSSIQFAGYSSDVFQVQGDMLTKNLFVLRRLANALGKFPGYKILLEGYAVSEYWNDPKTAAWEQKTQLLPLSLGRAQAVRNVMVLLGIDGERFTVQGFGGANPLVPNADLENRWKNRRVEFYLEKS